MVQKRGRFQDEKPLDVQNQAMKKRGFIPCLAMLLNSSSFGLAQSRTRCYVVYVRATCLRPLVSMSWFMNGPFVRSLFDAGVLAASVVCYLRSHQPCEDFVNQLRLPPLGLKHFLDASPVQQNVNTKKKSATHHGQKWREEYMGVCERLGNES